MKCRNFLCDNYGRYQDYHCHPSDLEYVKNCESRKTYNRIAFWLSKVTSTYERFEVNFKQERNKYHQRKT